jgi:hypothetical protein
MKKIYLAALGLLITSFGYSIGTIVLEGNYQGKNVYVQNPFASGGVGFCVQEVRVNGKVTTDEIGSSAFEIDLKAQLLKIGDKVEIKIIHKDGCKPKVLNPEVLKPKSTFEVVSISVDKDQTLKWQTKNEMGKLTYIVEQFRWNKWVKVGEVEGNGTPELNSYSFKIVPHSGKNKFQVKQVDYSGLPKVSKSAEYTSSSAEITFSPPKPTKEITFLAGSTPVETMFEIYDQYGNIIKRGFASSVDVASLPKGSYYLNYDNKMGDFSKK